jgi:hypothetical protein
MSLLKTLLYYIFIIIIIDVIVLAGSIRQQQLKG